LVYIVFTIQRTSDQNERVAAQLAVSIAVSEETYQDAANQNYSSSFSSRISGYSNQNVLREDTLQNSGDRYGSMSSDRKDSENLRRSTVITKENIQFLNTLIDNNQ
jgi:hypothetical protein